MDLSLSEQDVTAEVSMADDYTCRQGLFYQGWVFAKVYPPFRLVKKSLWDCLPESHHSGCKEIVSRSGINPSDTLKKIMVLVVERG